MDGPRPHLHQIVIKVQQGSQQLWIQTIFFFISDAFDNLFFVCQVEELESIYKPFKATPSEWMGCKGSSAQYRGYPCSVWQLFHSLMVNAAIKGDPSMVLGGSSSVAKAMVNYVHYFFSCRHCAENFRLKVETLGGFLPNTPRDSILWLWQIHNMANVKLRGKAEEGA